MSSEPGAAQGPHRVQSVVDELARTNRGRPLEATVQRLVSDLHAAGLQPPSSSWLDAVARAAVNGHSYIVSGTEQLESAGLHLGSPLEQAPARIRIPDARSADHLHTPNRRWWQLFSRPIQLGSSRPVTPDERKRAAITSLVLALVTALAVARRSRQPRVRPRAR